jgi:hypothetical protein
VDATLTGYKGERRAHFYNDLQQSFSALPGVLSVSYSQSALLSGNLGEISFRLPGTPPKAETQADYLPVGPGFSKP